MTKESKVFEAYDWKDISDDVDWKTGDYVNSKNGNIDHLFAGTKSRPRFSDRYKKYCCSKDGYFNMVGFTVMSFLIFKKKAYVRKNEVVNNDRPFLAFLSQL